MDCSAANASLQSLTEFLIQSKSLLWLYPTIWGFMIIRKTIFYS